MKLGYGLYIGHGVAIVINPGTIIGNNCNISQCLTIGTNHNTPAVIGDNVYIGPGVCIVEDVRIGNKIGFVSPERRYEAPTVARPSQM